MPTLSYPHVSSVLFFVFLSLYPSSSANSTTKLVDHVCRNTTDHSFCVDSLYSDPRTPAADQFVLAYIAFDLAYLNATHTETYIDDLLSNATAGNLTDPKTVRALQTCRVQYRKAVAALAGAINDLDSDTFFELGQLASVAGATAGHCEAVLEAQSKLLSERNRNLRKLCEICAVVSKLFVALIANV